MTSSPCHHCVTAAAMSLSMCSATKIVHGDPGGRYSDQLFPYKYRKDEHSNLPQNRPPLDRSFMIDYF